MKIFISADIEGITGVSHWDETTLESKFQAQMTKEVSAACNAAIEAGATEIVLKDAHATARNIDPSALPEEVKIIRGWSKGPLSMMEGIDESFDYAMYIGYHSAAFVEGNPLSHTFSNSKFQYIKLNNEYASEFDFNSLIADYFKVPSIFVSGDKNLCQKAEKEYEGIRAVAVSEGIGDASMSINPNLAINKISEGVKAAVKKGNKIRPLKDSYTIEFQFKEARDAYRAKYYPKAVQLDTKTISYTTDDVMDLLIAFMFMRG